MDVFCLITLSEICGTPSKSRFLHFLYLDTYGLQIMSEIIIVSPIEFEQFQIARPCDLIQIILISFFSFVRQIYLLLDNFDIFNSIFEMFEILSRNLSFIRRFSLVKEVLSKVSRL